VTRHKMLLSGYIGYFCRDERMNQGYDILSYIFMIHGLVLRGGARVLLYRDCLCDLVVI